MLQAAARALFVLTGWMTVWHLAHARPDHGRCRQARPGDQPVGDRVLVGAPIGALSEGELAKLVGPVHMFALVGAGCLASALAFARVLRPRGRSA